MESILVPDGPHTVEQAALLRAFQRIESQLDRLEGQVHKVESLFHQQAIRNVGNHGDLLKLSLDITARLRGLETQLGLHGPSEELKRSDRRFPDQGIRLPKLH